MLVVALASEEIGRLTLAEWDLLLASPRVLFELPDHPLRRRLDEAGIPTADLRDGDLGDREAAVVEPTSPLMEELAGRGAKVVAGSAITPDPLSAVRAAYVQRRAEASLGSLVAVMARLRGKDGCPWDAEQTHESLQQHLLEEAHEVLEAIDRGATGAELEDELGDLLLQVMFHSELAAEDGRFDIASVAEGIVSKLVRRHPHVFGDVQVADASEVVSNWEKIKQREREGANEGTADPFAGIPAGLPALVVASKTFKKAQGLDHVVEGPEAISDAHAALDRGDLGVALLWIVAAARSRHIDAEGALRRAINDFQASLTP